MQKIKLPIRLLSALLLHFGYRGISFSTRSRKYLISAPIFLPLHRSIMSQTKISATDISRTDAEWLDILTPQQFRVLREKGTEPPGFSEKTPGIFTKILHCRLYFTFYNTSYIRTARI